MTSKTVPFGLPKWNLKRQMLLDASFTMKVLTETRRRHLETCLVYLDCLKAFDRVKRDQLFEIYRIKIFQIYY